MSFFKRIGSLFSKESYEYSKFVKENGGNLRYFCEDGFKIKEKFLYIKAKAPVKYLINSRDCKGNKNGE